MLIQNYKNNPYFPKNKQEPINATQGIFMADIGINISHGTSLLSFCEG